jgi:crotonobetainyl-CoA:carnitine CoA-transferase CaiB-like acyl-CoA transferase
MLGYEGKTWDEPRGRAIKGYGPTDRLFRASDRWFYLAAPSPEVRALLTKVEGLEAINPNDAQLESKLVEAFSSVAAAAWVERLTAAGLSAAIALQLEEVMEEDYVKASGLSVLRDHPGVGLVRAPGTAPRLSLTPARLSSPAPLPGWDGREVLEAAGLGARYDELVAKGAILPELPGGAAAVV